MSAKSAVDSGAHMATDSIHRIDWPSDGNLDHSLKIVDVVCVSTAPFYHSPKQRIMYIYYVLVLDNGFLRFLSLCVRMMGAFLVFIALTFSVTHGFLMDTQWFYLPYGVALKLYFLWMY